MSWSVSFISSTQARIAQNSIVTADLYGAALPGTRNSEEIMLSVQIERYTAKAKFSSDV